MESVQLCCNEKKSVSVQLCFLVFPEQVCKLLLLIIITQRLCYHIFYSFQAHIQGETFTLLRSVTQNQNEPSLYLLLLGGFTTRRKYTQVDLLLGENISRRKNTYAEKQHNRKFDWDIDPIYFKKQIKAYYMSQYV